MVEAKKKKIVVADDDYAILGAIQETLEDKYLIYTAQEGAEAVRLVKKIRPDLVIMDVGMPLMDGLEACRQIKQDADTASIPVMFLSGKNELEDSEKAYNSGGNSYMVKPFSTEKLLSKVSEMIQKAEMRNELS